MVFDQESAENIGYSHHRQIISMVQIAIIGIRQAAKCGAFNHKAES